MAVQQVLTDATVVLIDGGNIGQWFHQLLDCYPGHWLTCGASGVVELRPEASLSFGLRLIGGNGLVAELPQRWLLTVRPDAPPIARLAGSAEE